MTTEGVAVSDAHIAACARNLLENSETLLNDRKDISVSQDAIDSINHDVHLAFALLARRYNSQVPVNRLHPELLGMVFEHLRAPTKVFDPDDLLEEPVFDLYKPLSTAMAVCHKWHAVASEKASLWTEVDYSRGGDGPSCLLTRSWMAPIHLRLEFSAEDQTFLLSLVRKNAARLRQLDLWTKDKDSMHDASQLLGFDMPLLQCLRMSDEYYSGTAIRRCSFGRFPSLRGMMLKCFFWLPTPEVRPLTKLTHLRLSALPDITVAAVATLLDATPALEVLELHDCGTLGLTRVPTRTTTLAHLTHLTVRNMMARVAAVLMPVLVLPRATSVCLSLEVDTRVTDAILPQPPCWHAATRIRVDDDVDDSLSVELEGAAHRLALLLDYEARGDLPLWPLPVPALPQLAHVSSAHLCILDWQSLRQFAARVPALAAFVVEARVVGPVNAGEMVDALREVLLQEDLVLCPGLREVALLLPCAVNGLTDCLAPALKKRKRDGRQVERLRTWIDNLNEDNTPEPTARDIGDALAEYVGAGVVEHEKGPFWPRDEQLWRRENEFWEVPRTWWNHARW